MAEPFFAAENKYPNPKSASPDQGLTMLLFRKTCWVWVYSLQPARLVEIASTPKSRPKWIAIDDVQKQPKLLDLAHKIIEEYGIKFALTGSSARKLKRGGANLLAGRAFVCNLFPLTAKELQEQFNLSDVLEGRG